MFEYVHARIRNHNPGVGGSSPSPATIGYSRHFCTHQARQMTLHIYLIFLPGLPTVFRGRTVTLCTSDLPDHHQFVACEQYVPRNGRAEWHHLLAAHSPSEARSAA